MGFALRAQKLYEGTHPSGRTRWAVQAQRVWNIKEIECLFITK